MKKNKGFTLVELLALIVILAVIALISTPVVLNMIESSRQGAAESSMLSYVDATEKAILTQLITNSSIDYSDKYKVDSSNSLTLKSSTYSSPCLTASGTGAAYASGTSCATGNTVNPLYQVSISVDLKGDRPDTSVAGDSVVEVSGTSVTLAKLKFGSYYVTYTYNTDTGVTKYCSQTGSFKDC
jgi:type IV pilus assembly protein PilA